MLRSAIAPTIPHMFFEASGIGGREDGARAKCASKGTKRLILLAKDVNGFATAVGFKLVLRALGAGTGRLLKGRLGSQGTL